MDEDASDLNVDIEYVADAMIDPSDPLYGDWIKVCFCAVACGLFLVFSHDAFFPSLADF